MKCTSRNNGESGVKKFNFVRVGNATCPRLCYLKKLFAHYRIFDDGNSVRKSSVGICEKIESNYILLCRNVEVFNDVDN